MKVSEMIESGAGRLPRGEQYDERGIEVVKNTPGEILDAVNEMEARLDGTWQSTEEDEELQRRFWLPFKSSPFHNPDGKIRGRIGTQYLRQNSELLQ